LIAVQITFLLVFLFCSGFFSSSEVALFSLSSMQVKSFKNAPDKRKQLVASLLTSPRDLLVTMLMLNVMINILIQNVTSSLFGDFSGWALNVGVPLGLTLIFGEVIPKSIGMANNAALSYRVAPFLNLAKRIFHPICKGITAVTSALSRLFFFFLKPEEEISFDELQHALKTSRHYGILNEDEAELVRGYLILQQSQVKELMRPREEVLFYDIEEPLSKLVHLFVDQECLSTKSARASRYAGKTWITSLGSSQAGFIFLTGKNCARPKS
jgi:putative hemolysin